MEIPLLDLVCMECVLAETIGKCMGSLEEEIGGTGVGSDGTLRLGGAVEEGCGQGAVLGIEVGKGDTVGLKGLEEGVAGGTDCGTGPKMEG